jgi:hypothetical protein
LEAILLCNRKLKVARKFTNIFYLTARFFGKDESNFHCFATYGGSQRKALWRLTVKMEEDKTA